MQHLKILFISLVFIAGLFMISYVNAIRKQYKFSYLKKIILYMSTSNAILLFLIAGIYFKTNLPQNFFFNNSPVSKNLFSQLHVFFIIVFVYLIISISAELLGKNIPKKFYFFFIIISLIYTCMETIMIFYPEIITNSKYFYFIYEYIFDNIILIEFFVLLYLLFANRKTIDRNQKKMIKSFSIIFILKYFLAITLFIIFVALKNHYLLQLIITAIFLLLIIAVPYIWVRYNFMKYIETLYNEDDFDTLSEKIFVTYKISEREKEIVKLMLKGKTNKEIENLLYISISTVKNHIYKIFKKLKINSRHQLVKFFNFTEKKNKI